MTQCDALGQNDSVCQLGTRQLCQHKQLQESPYVQCHCLHMLKMSLPNSSLDPWGETATNLSDKPEKVLLVPKWGDVTASSLQTKLVLSFHGITESFRLEKISEITDSNLWPITTTSTRPWHQVPHTVISWTLPGMLTTWKSIPTFVQFEPPHA